uniref:Uncharacterized protein n=1 Tax=Rhizophora mucronata TaxID=61149 RepID=A0A2P2MLC2_RHIMU
MLNSCNELSNHSSHYKLCFSTCTSDLYIYISCYLLQR